MIVVCKEAFQPPISLLNDPEYDEWDGGIAKAGNL